MPAAHPRPRHPLAGPLIVDAVVVLRLAGANLLGLLLIVLGAVRSARGADTPSVLVWINVALVGVAVAIAADAWTLLELRRTVRVRSHGLRTSAAGIVTSLSPAASVGSPVASWSDDDSASSATVTSDGDRIRWHHRPDCILQRGQRSIAWSPGGPVDRTPCPVCTP